MRRTESFLPWLFSSIVLLCIMIVLGLSFGYSSVSFDRLFPILMGDGSFKENFILYDVRMPRVLVLCLAGMALAMAGSLLQSLTRNDLADPGIIGINAGAGVGITIFYLFASDSMGNFAYMLPLVGFISALLTALCIYLFAYERHQGIQPFRLVLVGVGFATALSGLMILLISSAERSSVDFIAKWLAGNVWGADWPFVLALAPWLVVCIPVVLYKANALNILALSEPTAIGLGISLKRERYYLLIIAVALAAAAVSVTGSIGFVGLMAPHIAKALVGPRHQRFVPLALFIGATLLVFADMLGRTLIETASIPVGIVVSIIGAPYFLYLLKKRS